MAALGINKTIIIILAVLTLIIIIGLVFGKLYPNVIKKTDVIGKEFIDNPKEKNAFSIIPSIYQISQSSDAIINLIINTGVIS